MQVHTHECRQPVNINMMRVRLKQHGGCSAVVGVEGSELSQDKDGGIDEEGDEQGQRAVPGPILDGHALAEQGAGVRACLDDARVQVQVVGHHRGTCVHPNSMT